MFREEEEESSAVPGEDVQRYPSLLRLLRHEPDPALERVAAEIMKEQTRYDVCCMK